MNPIFSESVRRMLRRQRKAQQKPLDSHAANEVYFPSKRSLLELRWSKLWWFGLFGALITILCLFTPLPALLLSALVLDWLIKYLACGLFPALFIFIGIAVYAWWQNRA